MGFGFNWAPPSALVDVFGIEETQRLIKDSGLPVPKALSDAAKSGRKRFFGDPNKGRYFVAG
jgi:hypothetical protein